MRYEDRIDESRRHPKPVIRGSLITVDQILKELAKGATEVQVIEAHPRLTHEDIQAVREYREVMQERERILEASRRVLEVLDENELWRSSEGHKGQRAELRGADLRGLELPGVRLDALDLEGADLRGAMLSGSHIATTLKGANLSRAHLEGVIFENANLNGSCLQEAHLEGAALINCSLVEADLRRARLCGASLLNADFSRADLSEAELQGVVQTEDLGLRYGTFLDDEPTGVLFDGVDLSRADLRGADLTSVTRLFGGEEKTRPSFRAASVANTNLLHAALEGADFEGADLGGSQRDSESVISSHLAQVLKDHATWVRSQGRDGSRANFEGADLRGAMLNGANLSGANLCGARFEGAKLRAANLCGADARGAHFEGADMRGLVAWVEEPGWPADIDGTSLDEAVFSGANLSGALLANVDFSGAIFLGATLRDAHLERAECLGVDLRGADLSSAFSVGASFGRAQLRGACLENADIGFACLERADCERGDFFGARLVEAGLSHANLSYARLDSANLERARLDDAVLKRAEMQLATVWQADFDGAQMEAVHLMRSALIESASLRRAFAESQPRATLGLAFATERIRDRVPEAIAALKRVHKNVGMSSLLVETDAADSYGVVVTGQQAVLEGLQKALLTSTAPDAAAAGEELESRIDELSRSYSMPKTALKLAANLFRHEFLPFADAPSHEYEEDEYLGGKIFEAIIRVRHLPLGLIEDAVLVTVARDLSTLLALKRDGFLISVGPLNKNL